MIKRFFILPADIHEFIDLQKYRYKLIYITTVEKNRVQNHLTVSNLKLTMYFLMCLVNLLFYYRTFFTTPLEKLLA